MGGTLSLLSDVGSNDDEGNSSLCDAALKGTCAGAISSGILLCKRLLGGIDEAVPAANFAGFPPLSIGLLTTLAGVLGKISGGIFPFFFGSAEYVTTTLLGGGVFFP